MAKVKNSKSSGSTRECVQARTRSKQPATVKNAASAKPAKRSASKKKAKIAKDLTEVGERVSKKGVRDNKMKKRKASSTARTGRPRKRELMEQLNKLAADLGAEISSLGNELSRVSGRLANAERHIERLEERLAERHSFPPRPQQHVHGQRKNVKSEALDPLRSRAGAMSDGCNTSPVNSDAARSLSGSGNRPKKR